MPQDTKEKPDWAWPPQTCGHELLDPSQVHYCDYLSLTSLLGLNAPHASTNERDWINAEEKFFIAVHQVFEMLFAQHIDALRAVRDALLDGDWDGAKYALSRVNALTRLYSSLMMSLKTMSRHAFTDEKDGFRNHLGPASGLESEGFRVIELLSGITPDTVYGESHGHTFTFREFLDRAPQEGDGKPKTRLWTPHLEDVSREESLRTAFLTALRNAGATLDDPDSWPEHIELFGHQLRGYDRLFSATRKAHIKVVVYQIGEDEGTGHTSGVLYLQSVYEKAHFFPELRNL